MPLSVSCFDGGTFPPSKEETYALKHAPIMEFPVFPGDATKTVAWEQGNRFVSYSFPRLRSDLRT